MAMRLHGGQIAAWLEHNTTFVLWLFLLMAIGLAVWMSPGVHGYPFAYPHAWPSAHWAVMGRNFADHANFGVGLIPIQNNAFVVGDGDLYLHWPPLLPWVVGGGFKLLGTSDVSLHLLMLGLAIASAMATGFLVAPLYGQHAALLAALVSIAAPISRKFSHVAVPVNLALPLMIFALGCFVRGVTAQRAARRWHVVGALSTYLAVLASWEAALMLPGLVAASLVSKQRPYVRPTVIYSAAVGAALLTIFFLYFFPRLEYLDEFGQSVLHRMRLGSYSPHALSVYQLEKAVNLADENTSSDMRLVALRAPFLFVKRFNLFSAVGAIAIPTFLGYHLFVQRPSNWRCIVVILAVVSSWILWTCLVPNHFILHEFEAVLGLPLAALAVGGVVVKVLARAKADSSEGVRAVVLISCVLALPGSFLLGQLEFGVPSSRLDRVQYGRAIAQFTPPNAVIMQPGANMVPVFYSNRHTIRGVSDSQQLERILPMVIDKFHEYPVYLALQPKDVQHFTAGCKACQALVERDDLVLFQVSQRAKE
jgi:4-amino-4-deoxy-L-arabinose transferase-like glycosyltransferase